MTADYPKISVIMPVYNVKYHLTVAIDSILRQTFGDFELICVNDGSTDGSSETLKEYAQNDGRIKIISSEKNYGQSYARNKGLEAAGGKYICFVDGDDWIQDYMLEKLYDEAEKHLTDMSFCGTIIYDEIFRTCNSSDKFYSLETIPHELDNKVFNYRDVKDLISGKINTSVCNKIYRKEFLDNNCIKFYENFIYEDLPFFYDVLFKAERISFIRDCCYFYRTNKLDIDNSPVNTKISDRIFMTELTLEKFRELDDFEEMKSKITSWIIDDIFHNYMICDIKFRKEFFYQMKKLFKNTDFCNNNVKKSEKAYFYNEFCNILKTDYEGFNKYLSDAYTKIKESERSNKAGM